MNGTPIGCLHLLREVSNNESIIGHELVLTARCQTCGADLGERRVPLSLLLGASAFDMYMIGHEWIAWQNEQVRRAKLPAPYRSEIPRHGGEGDP